jgi:uncharacterized integral membrane protein
VPVGLCPYHSASKAGEGSMPGTRTRKGASIGRSRAAAVSLYRWALVLAAIGLLIRLIVPSSNDARPFIVMAMFTFLGIAVAGRAWDAALDYREGLRREALLQLASLAGVLLMTLFWWAILPK